MARWLTTVDEPIGPNEHIGRRLFDEPKLSGAVDQNPFDGLTMSNFEDSRNDGEFSVDRLGKSGIDKKVQRYLEVRAHAAAKAFQKPKQFDGWAVSTVKKLATGISGHTYVVVASPEKGAISLADNSIWSDEDTSQNRYHAHIVTDSSLGSAVLALLLRQAFVSSGISPLRCSAGVSTVDNPKKDPGPSDTGA